MSGAVPESIDLRRLRMRVHPMTAQEAAALLDRWATGNEKRTLAGHNLHSAFLLTESEPLARFYREESTVAILDGAPILMAARRQANGLSHHHRVGSLDWLACLPEHAPNIHRIAIVGAGERSNTEAAARLRERTGAETLGLPGSGWDAARADAVVASLREWEPDLVVVGLGMPLQEEFLLEHWERLPVAAYATVGGAIDQVAGVQRPAPRWLGRWGMEWAWRLATNPRRLAARYLVEPVRLAGRIATGRGVSLD